MECKLSVDMKTGEEIGTRDAIDETASACRILGLNFEGFVDSNIKDLVDMEEKQRNEKIQP